MNVKRLLTTSYQLNQIAILDIMILPHDLEKSNPILENTCEGRFNVNVLWQFLAVSIPLMFVTFEILLLLR